MMSEVARLSPATGDRPHWRLPRLASSVVAPLGYAPEPWLRVGHGDFLSPAGRRPFSQAVSRRLTV